MLTYNIKYKGFLALSTRLGMTKKGGYLTYY